MYIGEFDCKWGPMMPCLKAGEKTYTFTPEELSDLVHKVFHDGYQFAKSIYNGQKLTE